MGNPTPVEEISKSPKSTSTPEKPTGDGTIVRVGFPNPPKLPLDLNDPECRKYAEDMVNRINKLTGADQTGAEQGKQAPFSE
jgi:hypothetical protein